MPASIIAVWCPLLHCCIFLRYPVWCLLWHAGFGSIFLPPKLLHCASTSSCFQFGCGLQLGKGSWRSSALWHPAPCRAQWPAAAFRVLWQPLSIARLLTLAAAPHSVPCSRVQAPGVQLFLAQTYRQPLCRLRQIWVLDAPRFAKGSWRSSALWHPAPCRAQWPAAAFRVLWQPLSIARLLTLAAAPHSVPCSRVQAPGVQLFLAQTYRQPLCRLRQVAKAAWCFWYQNNGIRIVELNSHHPEGRQLQEISCRT